MHSPFIANLVVIGLIIAIIFSLAVSLFYLMSQNDGNRTYKALAWRISLSMLLFLGLLLAVYFGWVTPAPPPL